MFETTILSKNQREKELAKIQAYLEAAENFDIEPLTKN